jgi:hypothetical protein
MSRTLPAFSAGQVRFHLAGDLGRISYSAGWFHQAVGRAGLQPARAGFIKRSEGRGFSPALPTAASEIGENCGIGQASSVELPPVRHETAPGEDTNTQKTALPRVAAPGKAIMTSCLETKPLVPGAKFLASNAVPCPGNSLKAILGNFFATRFAHAVSPTSATC